MKKQFEFSNTIIVSAFVLTVAPVSTPAFSQTYDDTVCASSTSSSSNDPCGSRQWGIKNIKAPEAWQISQGEGVVVAVVDTGVDFNHPDLQGNLIVENGSDMLKNTAYRCSFQSPSTGDQASDAKAQDDHGHGTHVAGIIAAVRNNSMGVIGVAPQAKVMPVKVLDAEGSGSDRDVARGICFAADKGAKVINLSLGYDPASSLIIDVVLGSDTREAIRYAYNKGVAIIVAAGNNTAPLCSSPATAPETLCVGAVDKSDNRAWYSNLSLRFGPDYAPNYGVVAPGGAGCVLTVGSIPSLIPLNCPADDDVWSTILPSTNWPSGYAALAGTSMATPHVSGLAALLIAAYGPTYAPQSIYNKITQTADPVQGLPQPNPLYGWGRINALRAVTE
jgi:subtilisin family serine protease